ncbi:copper resistance protein NlpE [Shewanella corallii]|uniref:Copper resistance protein NlpE n=1 Tax=Shewanella corallii TaxID=560080 RepID=A0ABT0N4T1_9GAMM|nr:copper resistance protein NlpE [Shewanella corallii]MCL2913175.1 copper resistance protein NlpE [Shewanella corallii]
MKLRKSVVLTALCCVGLTACAQVTTQLSTEHKAEPATSIADSSKTSLDWSGTCTGTLPCASCSGIGTELTLEKNGKYQLRSDYQGEKGGKFTETGTFQWNVAGNKIVLSNGHRYLAGENQLFMLNSDGNRVQGPLAEAYRLKKIPPA